MDDNDFPFCPQCGSSVDWDDCDQCGGDGFHEVYDEDPLWYDPDDIEECGQCGGTGGWWMCLSRCPAVPA